jgi:hypothetical protein
MDLSNWDLVLKNVIGKDREFEDSFRLESQAALAEDRKSVTEEQAKLNFSLFNS